VQLFCFNQTVYDLLVCLVRMIDRSAAKFLKTIMADPAITLGPFVNGLAAYTVDHRQLGDTVTSKPVGY